MATVATAMIFAGAQSTGAAGPRGVDPAPLIGNREPFIPIPGLREFSGRLLVRVLPAAKTAAAPLLAGLDADVCDSLGIWSVAVPAGEDESTLAARLHADEKGSGRRLFAWVRPDWRVFVQGGGSPVTPNDPEYVFQWHHAVIGSARAWSATTGLREVTIAFVDTGVDLAHPDLAPSLAPGYCSYLTVRLPQLNDGVVGDAHGHGTSVAGAAAAVGNNATGVAGVGWRLSIMPIRATNPAWPIGAATSMDIINGALWAADHGARIVNVSFSGVSEPYVEDLGAALRTRHALLVWPIDNYAIGYGSSFDHPNVLVVAGTDQLDRHAAASSTGDGVDLCAPAVGVYTTTRGGGAWYQDGNSFAAPLVAGAAGLILSAASELSPAQVERVLLETADDLGPPGRDPQFGAGRLNAGRAVWLAPLRQFALGAAPEREVRAKFSVEDLYAQVRIGVDIDGDGVVTTADTGSLRDLLRYDESEETTLRGR